MQFRAIDRRTLLKGAAAAAFTSSSLSRAYAAPKKGGNLRIGMAGGNTTDSLDPATYIDSGMFLVGNTSKDSLVQVNSKNEVVPALAEKWESTTDAKRWVFTLRKGVTFHSGKSLTSEDVIASINHHRGADSKSSFADVVKPIEKIEADGAQNVVFTLKDGNADFAAIISSVYLSIMAANGDKVDATSKDGTGPYILEEFEPGVRTTFKRNPNYWNPDTGFVDTAEVLFVADAAARMNALRTGRVDVINRVDVKTATLLGRVSGIKIEEAKGGQHYVFCMFVDAKPFDDVNVRTALKYAIKRQEMVDKILAGHGYVGNDHPIPVTNKYFAKDLLQREYDPDKAKFYLKKAGLTSLEVPLSVAEAGFAGATDAGVLYEASAKECGITIKLTREPNDGYFDNVWMKKPFTVDYWSGHNTADLQFSYGYAAEAPYNETHWKNPRFNELLVAARVETDEAKRSAMYQEMQLLVHDDGGSVIPMFANHVWAKNDKVGHEADVGAELEMDGLRCISRWWMA